MKKVDSDKKQTKQITKLNRKNVIKRDFEVMDNSKRRKLTLYSLVVGMLMVLTGIFSFGVYALSNLNIDTTGKLIYADDKVCYIAKTGDSQYDKYYDSLGSALSAASDGDVICIFRNSDTAIKNDITIDKSVVIKAVEQEITLDLGVYSIIVNSGKTVNFNTKTDGKTSTNLTITSSKNYDMDTNAGGVINNSGTLTLGSKLVVNATGTMPESEDDNSAPCVVYNAGTLNINGANLDGGNEGIGIYDVGTIVTVNSGTITGEKGIYSMGTSFDVNILGGTITGGTAGILAVGNEKGELSVSNPSAITGNEARAVVAAGVSNLDVIISGGTFGGGVRSDYGRKTRF